MCILYIRTSGLGDDVIVCILARIPSVTEHNRNTTYVHRY